MFSSPLVFWPQPARDQAEKVWLVLSMKSGAEGVLEGLAEALEGALEGEGMAWARRGRRKRRKVEVYIFLVGGFLVSVVEVNGGMDEYGFGVFGFLMFSRRWGWGLCR